MCNPGDINSTTIVMLRSIPFILFTVLFTVRLLYQPSAKANIAPLPDLSALAVAVPDSQAKLIHLKGAVNNNKVLLNWTVSENENAEYFQVEKSTDGKNFIIAALVFGTDKSHTDNYQFYEKATNGKLLYRIKMISKEQTIEYSNEIEIKQDAELAIAQ